MIRLFTLLALVFVSGHSYALREIKPLEETLPEEVEGDTSPNGYNIKQTGNNLELVTPYGRRRIFGDQGFDRAKEYRLEIPLDELRPPKPKVAEPVKPEPVKAEAEEARKPASEKNTEDEPEDTEETGEVKETVPPRVVVEYDYTDRLVLEANRLYNRRQFYEASLTVEEILTRRPDFARGWVMKGSLMYVQGQKDLAKTAWQKALELDPNNMEVKQYLGRLK